MNTADESELPTPALPGFARSPNKHAVLCYPEGSLYIFCWLILDTFHWVLLSVGLIRSSTSWNSLFDFLEGTSKIEDSISNPPYTQHHLLWIDWPLMRLTTSVAPWSLPFHMIVQCPLLFPITICFKNWMFSLCFSRESSGNSVSRVFLLNLCGTQTSKQLTYQADANYFQSLIWIFWVCQLSSSGITLIVLN